MRKTIECLARLLHKMENTCLALKSKMRSKETSKVVERIQNIYFELVNLSVADLKMIVNSFEIEFSEPHIPRIEVPNDEHMVASGLILPSLPLHEKKSNINIIQDCVASTGDNLRVNIMQYDDGDVDHDNLNQSIECDLWSPTTDDMMSLISPENSESNGAGFNDGYTPLMEEDQHVDDLRRTHGSFDNESVEDEREPAPPFDEGERAHTDSFPATFARRVVSQRSRQSRFWKKRFTALKSRRRQATAE